MSKPETVIPSSQITATITAAARAMYPHDALPDEVYARVADKLAEAAREDSGATRLIEDGVSTLNGGRPFAELSADEQLKMLRGIEGSDFFELVRSTAVVEVYSDQRTWKLAGYEGPSFDKGGHINLYLPHSAPGRDDAISPRERHPQGAPPPVSNPGSRPRAFHGRGVETRRADFVS